MSDENSIVLIRSFELKRDLAFVDLLCPVLHSSAMPLVSIEPGVRLFYNTYSPNGSDLDSSKETILILHPRMLDHEIMAPQYNDEQLRKEYNMVC